MTRWNKAQGRNSAIPPDAGTKVRVALIGEGTYPVVMGGVSTWYDQLVNGLEDYEFEIVTLVGEQRSSRWELPPNVAGVTMVPMWDPPARAPLTGRKSEDRRVRAALHELWDAALPAQDPDASHIMQATIALKELARGTRHRLAATLHRISSAEMVADSWNRYRSTRSELPALTLAQAGQVAHFADRILAVLDAPWPQVDISHVTSNGPAALMGLARYWREGTPMVLTEHGVYLRERYLGLGELGLAYPVRAALLGLTRLICQVAYAEATELSPVSDFNAKWAGQLGANPQRMHTVHNGVDVAAYQPITTEPEQPTISFVGRIDPLKDLATMIRAFATVTARIPQARLRLFGPIPEQNQDYHQQLVALIQCLGLEHAVSFEGKVPNARIAAEAGHVVALSSISEGLPFTVIEAMMCSRATISTDVGGISEITGRDGLAGALVPPRNPEALGEEMTRLLLDAPARRQMGMRARDRAMQMFSLDLFYQRMRTVYRQLLEPQTAEVAANEAVAQQPVAVQRPSLGQQVLPALKNAAQRHSGTIAEGAVS